MNKIFVIAFSTLSFVSNIFSQEWITFNSHEGRFSVQMPGQPTQQLDSSSTYPKYKTNMFISKSATDYFVIGFVDYESAYGFDAQKELESNRDNFIAGIKGTLASTKNIEFKGYKGLEFIARGNGIYWTSKVFIVGRRPYQMLVGSSNGKASENENKFYDSFTITKY